MIFRETPVSGAFLVELEPRQDERGYFARSFCAEEFAAHGLEPRVAQINISFNRQRGTLRGMHYQAAPHEETKLVRATRGRIFDVLIDLRPESPSYRRWFGAELDASHGRALYVPRGCAHGFLTLEAQSEVLYLMGEPYEAEAARGIRYDDPVFAIQWPEPPALVSERDLAFPPFGP